MKVLHTSDWHLGQQFYEHSRFEEHQHFLNWLCDTLAEQQIDLLLIAGDIYHTATPPASAEQQLYQFIQHAKQRCPQLHIVLIAGNHDSANRIETAKPLLCMFDTHVVGRYDKHNPSTCLIPITTQNGSAQVVAMPFLRPADLDLDIHHEDGYQLGIAKAYQDVIATKDDSLVSPLIVMGHLHAKGGSISEDSERNINIGGYDAVSADVFTEQADYVALGHLHKAQQVAKCTAKRYCGTPMPMSFSEKNYKHQVLVIDFDDDFKAHVNPLYIPRFRDLIVLPEQGGASLDELCDVIATLNLEEHNTAPYLRLRLNASETDSQFRHKIEEALKGKDVLFCGIERVQTVKAGQEEITFQDLGKVEQLDPLELLTFAFKQQVDAESPVPNEVQACLEEVLNNMDEENVQ